MHTLDIILVAAFSLGICKEYQKHYKTNNERLLYDTAIFSIIILSQFFLSFNFMLALLGFVGFSILIYKSHIQKSDKSLTTLALVFLLMGLVFFAQQFLGFKM
jgi:hypothetical protein